jgi:hypothetical protein
MPDGLCRQPVYASVVVSAFRDMMREDRERLGLSVARASWLLGVSVRRYRGLEDVCGWTSSPGNSAMRRSQRRPATTSTTTT